MLHSLSRSLRSRQCTIALLLYTACSSTYRFGDLLRNDVAPFVRALLAPLLLRLRAVIGRIPAIVSSINRSSTRLSRRMVSIKSISATTAARCARNAASCSSVRVAHVSAICLPIVIECAAGSTARQSGPLGAPCLTASTRVKPPLLANAVCDTKPPDDVDAIPAVTSRYETGVCGTAAPPAPVGLAPPTPALPPLLPPFRRGDFRRPGDEALPRGGDFRPARGGVRHGRSSPCAFGAHFFRAVAFTLC